MGSLTRQFAPTFDEATATDVVPACERMAAAIVPDDVLLERPTRVLGARQGRGSSQAYPHSISCYLPGYIPPGRPTTHRVLVDAARAAGTQWRSGADSHEAAIELWNALRASFVSLTGEELPALGRLERSASTPGGKVRILLREPLIHRATFDEASWGVITEQLTHQMKLLADRPLRAVGLEFTPAAEIAAAAGGVPRSFAAVPALRPVPGTIQSARGETHAATLIRECLQKTGTVAYVPQDRPCELGPTRCCWRP